jgi:iron complex outermembrane receptor protein
MKINRSLLFVSASAFTLGVATPSLAQESPEQAEAAAVPAPAEEGMGDIVVTAQKRSETAQRTPLAITAVSGTDLETRQITDFEKMAPSLPNVNFGKNVGFARIAIRGLGFDSTTAGQEGRVAYHTDGVYISRPSAQLASFFDISRVEVIRGPQGTLYGRNATAGAVNVVTNEPEQQTGGYAKLTVGNFGLVATEVALTGPVSDTVAARIAFQTTDRSGYGENLLTGETIDNEHSFAVRGKLKFEPAAAVKLLLSAEYSHQDGNNFVYHYIGPGKPGLVPVGPRLGGRVASNPRDTFGDDDQINKRRFFGASAALDVDLGFGSLTSISAYRDSNTAFVSDGDGTDLQIGTFHIDEIARQFSQEVRLNGETGRLRWLVGGFYFNEHIYARTTFDAVRAPNPVLLGRLTQGLDFRGNFTTDAYAAFGQLDYEIVDGLTISGGIRFSHEKKSLDQKGVVDFVTPYDLAVPPAYNQFQNSSATFNSTTPRINIEYRFTPRIMAYATYSKGFKSGGYALSALGQPVQPERLTDYEAGFKSDLFDGRLRLNLSGFYYDYTNLQVQRIIGGTAVMVNAASAKVKGIEGEFVIKPVDGFEISGNASWLHARFSQFMTEDSARLEQGMLDLGGNKLPQAPDYVVNLAAQYTADLGNGDLTVRGEASWTDEVFFSAYNRPEVSQGAFEKFNLSLAYAHNSGVTATAFVRNLTNKRTISTEQVSGGFFGFPIMGAYDPPRTYGISIGYRF